MNPLVLWLVASICIPHPATPNETSVQVCTLHRAELPLAQVRECAFPQIRKGLVHAMAAEEGFEIPDEAVVESSCRLVDPTRDSTGQSANTG